MLYPLTLTNSEMNDTAYNHYNRNVLQRRFDPKKLSPIKLWREELAAKTTEREASYREYDSLKIET